jgi:glycosyltransferase involved in cell wall biosynthesis
MKIINAMFSKVNGGLEQVFLNYNPTLMAQGHEVISVVHPQAEVLHACPQGQVRTIHNYNQYDFIAILKLRRLIQHERPDCIITHSYRAAYLFKKTRTRVPKIAVCHVQGHYNFGADAIIAITEQMRSDIINSGIPADKVFVVPNMVPSQNLLSYKPLNQNKVPIIGVCARFVSMKGIDLFLAALAELKKRNCLFKAHIAGDGPEKDIYLRLIQEYQLTNEVTLLGWVEDRSQFYNSLDIFCLPSRKEAFGLVILESMMHSLPMALTALPGPLEIIGDSNAALFSPPEDIYSMANNLEQLIVDKELAEKLAKNAHARVQKYTTNSVSPILDQTLKQICTNYQMKGCRK